MSYVEHRLNGQRDMTEQNQYFFAFGTRSPASIRTEFHRIVNFVVKRVYRHTLFQTRVFNVMHMISTQQHE